MQRVHEIALARAVMSNQVGEGAQADITIADAPVIAQDEPVDERSLSHAVFQTSDLEHLHHLTIRVIDGSHGKAPVVGIGEGKRGFGIECSRCFGATSAVSQIPVRCAGGGRTRSSCRRSMHGARRTFPHPASGCCEDGRRSRVERCGSVSVFHS